MLRPWLTSKIMNQTKNIILPWPESSVIERSTLEKGIQSLKTIVNRMIYRHPTPKTPDSYNNIAMIGIHGWFPGKIITYVTGDPIGTSNRFLEKLMQAFSSYYQDKYQKTFNVDQITKIPLIGDGKVFARVESFYEQIKDSIDWKNKLKNADLIVIAAHSQGTPVGILLLDRLIRENYLNPKEQRIVFLGTQVLFEFF
jgi:hypothetical protein